MNANEVPEPPFWVVLFLTTVILLGMAGLLTIGQRGMCELRDDALRYCVKAVR